MGSIDLTSRSVAVTGGAGFLGAHLVRELLDRACRVTVLVRPGGDRRNLEGLPVTWVEGDMAAGGVPLGFLRDASILFHLAAVYSERPADVDVMERVNVGGTAAVLEAAVRSDVERVVHCSTMGTCVVPGRAGASSERDRPDPGGTSAYHRTKLLGEDLALAAVGLDVVVGNPAAPVGAFDRKPTVTGRRVLDVVTGRWPRLLEGPINHVPARGVARGLILVAERGRPGERYLLGGEDLSPEAFIERVCRAAGIPKPHRTWLMRLRGKGKPSPGSLRIDDAKARSELGYDPGDLDLAFREAAAWFRSRPM